MNALLTSVLVLSLSINLKFLLLTKERCLSAHPLLAPLCALGSSSPSAALPLPASVHEKHQDDVPLGLDFKKLDHFTSKEKKSEARRLLLQASKFSGARGEGRQGWLHLLAAASFDERDVEILQNLISNYQALGYESLALSQLQSSKELSQATAAALMSTSAREVGQTQLDLAAATMQSQPDPGPPCANVLFSTPIARWDLTASLPEALNDDIYQTSVNAYLELKRARPELSDTDLNHAFFRVQMSGLEKTSSFWGPFQQVEGFEALVGQMRLGAKRFLRDLSGWSEAEATRKASHPLVVWVSVHTPDSVHQPHVTEDALIGGVWYVRVPKGSGRLDLFDPRGKHPLRDLVEPTSKPHPPFHRTASVVPSESTLVLFPGWLVHSVAQGEKKFSPSSEYRVSLSLNLKGEWQDTASAAFGCRQGFE